MLKEMPPESHRDQRKWTVRDSMFVDVLGFAHCHIFRLPVWDCSILDHILPVVPHEAVAEVSRRRKLYERLVVVSHRWLVDWLID